MKLGLLGCGSVAYWLHLRAVRQIPEISLAAAVDPDPAARQRLNGTASIPVYERAEELLRREDIEAVLICAPTGLHAELAIAAARARKHFYLEKPIASTAAQAQEIVEAARRAGVIGVMGYNRRRHPLFEWARELLANGCIGRVRGVQTAFCEPTPAVLMPAWKRHRSSGGGVLLDLASHHIDQLRWMLNEEAAVIAAAIRSEDTDCDTARIELTMTAGVEVQGFFSFRAGLADYLHFTGERGTLQVDRHAASLSLRLNRRGGYYGTVLRPVRPSPAVAAWRLERWWRPGADPSYRRSLRDFVGAVHGRSLPSATLDDGVRSLEVVLAAEEAASTRQPRPIERGVVV
jgi:predicted dehydrogenase